MTRAASTNPPCGAKTRNGECKKQAGWGTDHLGFGPCKLHMGNTPSVKKASIRKQLAKEALQDIALLGEKLEVDPDEMLILTVKRTAGVLAWLENKIQTLDEEDLVEFNVKTETYQPSVWVVLHAEERERLAKLSKLALDAGVAERAIALAEQQGQMIAKAIEGILLDLELSPEQRSAAPDIVRKRLTSIVMEIAA